MKEILFKYEKRVTWIKPYTSPYLSTSVSLYTTEELRGMAKIEIEKSWIRPDLEIEHNCGNPVTFSGVSFFATEDVVKEVTAIIQGHYEVLKRLVGGGWNGIPDGCKDSFVFGNVRLHVFNIRRTELSEIKERNPNYYRDHRETILRENAILDVYDEIAHAFGRYHDILRPSTEQGYPTFGKMVGIVKDDKIGYEEEDNEGNEGRLVVPSFLSEKTGQ